MKKLTTEEFIEKAQYLHEYKYGYNESIYLNGRSKIKITCPVHGTFEQVAQSHLNGKGCPKCFNEKRAKTDEAFIKESILIHENKYEYDKIKYVNNSTKVLIKCKKHGYFLQEPRMHLSGQGCPKCSGLGWDVKDFIKESKIVHGEKYIYDELIFDGKSKKIPITCREHGIFWQLPRDHLKGCGCPNCQSSKGENLVNSILQSLKISFEREKIFSDLCGVNGGLLRFDFFIPHLNLCIEYDGQQHYEKIDIWKENFDVLQKHDKMKNEYCEKEEINLLRIPYNEDAKKIILKYLEEFDEKYEKEKQ